MVRCHAIANDSGGNHPCGATGKCELPVQGNKRKRKGEIPETWEAVFEDTRHG